MDGKAETSAKMSPSASEWQSDEEFKHWLVFMGYAHINNRGRLRLQLTVYKQTKSLVLCYMHQAFKAGVKVGTKKKPQKKG